MRAEYLIAVTLIAVAVIAALAGLAMGPQWRVSASATVAAPPAKVIAYLSDFRTWRRWSVWNKRHFPRSRFSYRGGRRGVGAEQVWNVGPTTTVWHILKVDNDRIDYRRQTNDGPIRHGRFRARPRGGGSRLTWAVSGRSGINPYDRLIAWFYSGRIRDHLRAGLKGIQRHFAGAGGSS